MKKTTMLLMAGLFVGVPAFAAQQREQHKWYILSFGDGECHAAAAIVPRAVTPEQVHNLLRNQGIVDNIDVTKDDAGNVDLVTISYSLPGHARVAMLWFPSSELCEDGKILAKTTGLLPDTEDLR